ncbi:UPF0146 family protein [Haloferax namakaokahaiae]|uniref:UPF0146 protein ACFQJC_14145 n=1 Tax=Haloferax namakaokahaiae TaxID=1748331 RepID=A0ABD5ZHZ6_9EURY
MRNSLRDAIAAQLADYERVLEVGIGRNPDVAESVAARGVEVTAVDVREFPVPDGVRLVIDDVFSRADAAGLGPYAGVDVVYALNLPIELHRPVASIARRAGAEFYFTTLGYDEPSIPVRRISLDGDTLYVAEELSGRS